MDILFWYFFVSIFVIGAIIGSFLNCLIWRSYTGESALSGRSYCPKCRHELAWFDLVPVFSFLALRGKCRYCAKPISWQYPAVELATGILFVAIAGKFAPMVFWGGVSFITLGELLAYWVVMAALAVIFVADLRWYFIPDGAVIWGLIAAAVLRGIQFAQSVYVFNDPDNRLLVDPLLASFFAAAFFLSIFLVSRGRWIGFGDVKYALLMGAVLGFPGILIGLFLANFFGAIIGSAMIFAGKKKMSSEIPFGPFLVAGTLVALFFADPLINWYLSLSF